jgi:hypothetical protein
MHFVYIIYRESDRQSGKETDRVERREREKEREKRERKTERGFRFFVFSSHRFPTLSYSHSVLWDVESYHTTHITEIYI